MLSAGGDNVAPVENLLDGLTDQQRRAVTVNTPRLRILAGAGSGKTRVLTRRIAHQARARVIEPRHTLALTFTRKAAGELRRRLRALGLSDTVAAGTFHAQAYAQLRARWADEGLRPPELLDRRGRLVFRLLPGSMGKADRLAVLAELDWATARRITPDDYVAAAEAAGRRPPLTPSRLADYYGQFVAAKRKRRLVDFDDLLELCIRDLAHPDHARARHWRFRSLFVDEFQDVNPLQFDLLVAWLGPESSLCVVGDPNQAIYGWNGADAGYLDRFDEHFPGAETVELGDNFRSSPQILAAAAAVRGRAGALRANRPDGPLPTVQRCDNEFHEARAIARRVRDRHRPGQRWSRQAVLVRTNAQTTLIAEALRKAKVPVSIKEGASILDDARVVERLDALAKSAIPLTTALAGLRHDADTSADDETRDALDALANLAEDQLSLRPEADTTEFVGWVRATARAEDAPGTRDAVDLVTFHGAKGLEWPVVHLAGLEDGLVPIARATTAAAAEEEVRLLYVAITRAQQELHCSWAGTRRFGQRTVERRPSPLLEQMTATGPRAVGGRDRNVRRARELRQSLGVEEMSDVERRLRDEIREWRRQTARASGVPAYVVFPDRTLDALVTQRPSSLAELHQIPGLGRVKVDRYGAQLLELL